MNHKLSISFLVASLLVLAVAGAAAQSSEPAAPQAQPGTGSTYQGQLKNASGPVNGTCDLQFSLWDAASAGVPVGTAQTASNVAVTGGLFTVQLDFGAAALNGDGRWLQIDVRCPAGGGAATVGGGQKNTAGSGGATVGGGDTNTASGLQSTIGGGAVNLASSAWAAIGGGTGNSAGGQSATVAGGSANTASGEAATVGGGNSNTASARWTTVGGAGATRPQSWAAQSPGAIPITRSARLRLWAAASTTTPAASMPPSPVAWKTPPAEGTPP